jgi:hypothetical protein
MDLEKETTDYLEHLLGQIRHELSERKKAPTCACYVVKVDERGTYFKDFEAAKSEILGSLQDVKDFGNVVQIAETEIPKTDYDMRPDVWFDV